ncbi:MULTISPECIES: cytochrome c oxidase subunit II [Chryseobacterium]|uniref:Cytochrome o ubiquinol oxidase subunit 2 n=2 Tax=Chryseobacterium TaxID=59732 RepID=A0ABU0TE51_9FLAO|nr:MULTISPECIES: hypothetical protein [Chryseobacterium]MDQ1095226.1 cytochrome o ubiquinol oxidase subunit 2 [Chryseobacterium camelliae]MDR6130884.1 cytochrome o ubiquinol oxidase subunit 2 [Chryseobacterium sp. SORGH_AS_1175]
MKNFNYIFLVILLFPICLSAESHSFLQPMGDIAAEQKKHFFRVILITMVAILPVLIGVPIIIYKFRKRKDGSTKGKYLPNWEYNSKLELLMWAIPVLIVMILGFWLAKSTTKLDPYKPLGKDALVVQVVALDWKWLFIYPDQHIATVNNLVIPENRPIQLVLTSDTVMQSFIVPSLAGQIYVMPSMTSRLNFIANTTGTAMGENTQYNGDGFSSETFTVKSVTADEWKKWIKNSSGTKNALDFKLYEKISQQSTAATLRKELNVSNLTFTLNEPMLFKRIIQQYHNGKPIPPTKQAGSPNQIINK